MVFAVRGVHKDMDTPAELSDRSGAIGATGVDKVIISPVLPAVKALLFHKQGCCMV